MAIEIIDGVGSENHVTSDQVGLSQAGTIGTGAIILPVGQQLGYEIVSNNQVNIKDGVYVIQGKRGWIRPGTVEQCTIQTGNNRQYRNDLICIKYTKNAQSKVEEFSIAVVKGTPGASGADPTYTTGDINDGALESYAPIYRVRLNGINIIGVDLMASKVSSLLETAGKIGNLNDLATSAKTSLVAAANELQAAITTLNGNLGASYNYQVDIGNQGAIETWCNINLVKFSESKCNIHIQMGLVQVNSTSDSAIIFNMEQLRNLFGLSTLNFDTGQSNFVPLNAPESLKKESLGCRGGLQINQNGEIGRYYNYNNQQSGWGTISVKNATELGILKVGDFYTIDIYGANISSRL